MANDDQVDVSLIILTARRSQSLFRVRQREKTYPMVAVFIDGVCSSLEDARLNAQILRPVCVEVLCSVSRSEDERR